MLALALIVGAAVYAAVIWITDKQAVEALVSLVRGMLRRNSPAAVAPDIGTR